MIFAVETEERTLYAFATEVEAISMCEGLDVEAAVWLFWDDRGKPLEPSFSVPSKRGLFAVRNGVYSLVPASLDHHADLDEALSAIEAYEGKPPFNSLEGVLGHLRTKRSTSDDQP